jgi:hypothetical protein
MKPILRGSRNELLFNTEQNNEGWVSLCSTLYEKISS